MRPTSKALRSLLLCLLFPFTCPAQSTPLPPALAYRMEALLRSKLDLPPASTLTFGPRSPGEIPGYDRIVAHFRSSLTPQKGDISLLLSHDGTHLAQFTAYDIAADPRSKLPADDRPARGGPPTAPVLILAYDDLECPFCARLHADLFPALTQRYGDQVRIVYRSFPSEGHPWAMHAAVDTDCLATQSTPAYWAAVDRIHSHAAEYGSPDRSLAQAQQQLDAAVTEEGHRFHVDETALNACIQRQDTAPEKASVRAGDTLGVAKTPTLFINGAKIEGAVPLAFVFQMIDNALKAEGQLPPPPYQQSPTNPAPAQ